jgi:4-amino-4-deoxychorismate lyase
MTQSLINGLVDNQLNAFDRGLNYGDGLFETIAIRNGKPLLWDAHIERMSKGAQRLAIPFEQQTRNALLSDFNTLCARHSPANHVFDGVLKFVLTRGVGPRGYKAQAQPDLTRIASISAISDNTAAQKTGISVVLCATQLARQPLLAGIKHLNRLEQVLARNEWACSLIGEGIVSDTQGFVIEGCMSNLFWITDNVLYTPDLTHAGVEGVVRNAIIELCQLKQLMTVKIGDFTLADVLKADEVFVCNSVVNILPVTNIYDVASAVSDVITDTQGWPKVLAVGAKTQQLQSLLDHFYLEGN